MKKYTFGIHDYIEVQENGNYTIVGEKAHKAYSIINQTMRELHIPDKARDDVLQVVYERLTK